GRIARWALRLQAYDFEIVHRKGKQHVVPDALSRTVPVLDLLDNDSEAPSNVPSTDRWYKSMCDKVTEQPQNYPLWRIENKTLYKRVTPRYPNLADEQEFWREVVPKEARSTIISEHHDPPHCAHLGVYKTYARIASKYYWPKMEADVARYVNRCATCLRTKPEQRPPKGQMLSVAPTTTRPWQVLSLDLVGPLPRSSSGYNYILSVMDIFSKFVLLHPLRSASGKNICKYLEEQVFLVFGVPMKLITDNGSNVVGREMTSLLERYKVIHQRTANYHAQANPVERAHRVIKTALTAYVGVNHRSWETYLPQVAAALRSAKHETTQLTPNFVIFGREVLLSGKDHRLSNNLDFQPEIRQEELKRVFDDVQKRLKQAYERSSHRYNLRRRPEAFHLHQKVWKRNFTLSDAAKGIAAKFAPKYDGPFTVTKIVSPWTYELTDEVGRNKGVWSAHDLKAHPPDDVPDSRDI
ncbi:unnamed protein product, partial [Callosobruchus maculatus]